LVAAEIADQLADQALPTHVFLQVGCGGMAASIISRLLESWSEDPPTFITVEPLTAACLLETAQANKPVIVGGDHRTVMGGLACGEVSTLAWDYLRSSVDHFLAIPDAAALAAMRRFADPCGSDDPIVSGETGAAGLGALMYMRGDEDLSHAIGLDSASVVLVIVTEGATDTDEFERIVGRPPAAVERGKPKLVTA
jgi:diaminopropionate ammonia-lyase